jgi:hypothetical protein
MQQWAVAAKVMALMYRPSLAAPPPPFALHGVAGLGWGDERDGTDGRGTLASERGEKL